MTKRGKEKVLQGVYLVGDRGIQVVLVDIQKLLRFVNVRLVFGFCSYGGLLYMYFFLVLIASDYLSGIIKCQLICGSHRRT